jgi:hypothetical protein
VKNLSGRIKRGLSAEIHGPAIRWHPGIRGRFEDCGPDRRKRGVRLCERQCGLQSSHHVQPRGGWRAKRRVILSRRQGDGDFRIKSGGHAEKARRRHPDNREDLLAQPHAFSDDTGICSEAALPARVADHADKSSWSSSDAVVGRFRFDLSRRRAQRR